jgi:formamidase
MPEREVVYGTGKQEIRTAAKVSLSQPAAEQTVLHVRYCLSILFIATDNYRTAGIQIVRLSFSLTKLLLTIIVPSISSIKDGEIVKIECVDWTGGQIKNTDDADDVKNVDLSGVHYLTGPFDIEGAEPGDVLLVEIQDVQPFQDHLWGFTGIFDKSNGGGFLDEIYPKAAKAIWDFEGIFCSSRQ